MSLAAASASVAAQESPSPGASAADAAESGAPLTQIVITATRVAQSSFDLPVAVDRVIERQIRAGQLQVNLSESLDEVPGVSVQSRQNYAQDLQLSVRGFGARSSFGVRGVRLYSDGIPGTMPDGQGQFSQFDLGSADHIEVLRGPFSALYGNSSGGVIASLPQEGKPGFRVEGTAEYGNFDTQRYALKAAARRSAVNYVVDAAHFRPTAIAITATPSATTSTPRSASRSTTPPAHAWSPTRSKRRSCRIRSDSRARSSARIRGRRAPMPLPTTPASL